MRFATFNIRTGRAFDGLNSWPLRRGSTASVLTALGADVIGLQEAYEFQRRYLERSLADGRWFGQGRSGGSDGEQCCIAVTNPKITVVGQWTKWYGPEPDTAGVRLPGASFPRIATILRCHDERSGSEFDVANTHLDEHINANRASSVRQLIDWIDDAMPTVVLGDFNAEPDNEDVLGPFDDARFQLAPVTGGTTHNFTGGSDGRRIDHIFMSPHWTIEDAAVVREFPGRRLPSDHWPVCATATLADDPTTA